LLKKKNITPNKFLLGHSILFDGEKMIDFSLLNINIEKILHSYFPEIKVDTTDHFENIIEMK
jgi:hypothetical protein